MMRLSWFWVPALFASLIGVTAPAQQPGRNDAPPAVSAHGPVVLDWTPPALGQLSALAAVKNSFTLDRTMLTAAASLMPDTDEPTRQAINRVDGVSLHLLRFGQSGVPDEGAVNSIREAYHLRGWKHVVTTSGNGGPVHDGTRSE